MIFTVMDTKITHITKNQIKNNPPSGYPATWKTWKCQGISLQGEKVREFLKNKKVRESQGILLCEIHFQPI